jgi:nitroimidazol reductase NimA-like FMN-containing flavoprotein (pyridoxamine 5'-phosphate oxidase superfamily)
MPGYGLPADERGLEPWEWAEKILREAHNYWLATARSDGRPHVMPVWAVWWGGAIWLSTGGESRKARNLGMRPECSIGAEHGAGAVIVEGEAERMVAAAAPPEVARTYQEKYGGGYPEDSPVFRIEPRVAFGFCEATERFGETATRWLFERK